MYVLAALRFSSTGIAACLQPMVPLEGRVTSWTVLECFISQLLSDKIKFGRRLDPCVSVFHIMELSKWYRWWFLVYLASARAQGLQLSLGSRTASLASGGLSA